MKITEKPKVAKQVQSFVPSEAKYSVSLKPDVVLPPEWSSTSSRFVDVDEVGEVKIPFRIDVEAREWGIKGIMVNIDPIQASVEIVVLDARKHDADGSVNEEHYVKTITFDPSQIRMWLEGGSAVTITSLELALNEDFSVNYEKSAFAGTTLMGTGE